jgi:hypothetical protein
VDDALLSTVNGKVICGVAKIYLIHVLALRSRKDTATLCQEMKACRINFRILVNLSTIRILLYFFCTKSLLKHLSEIVSSNTVFRTQSLW